MFEKQRNFFNLSLKATLKKLLVIFFLFLGLFLFAAFLIAWLRLYQKGFSLKVSQEALSFAQKIIFNPSYLFDVYSDWGKFFWQALGKGSLEWAWYIPLLFPLVIIVLGLWCLIVFYKKFLNVFPKVDFSNPIKLYEKGYVNGSYSVLGMSDNMLLQMPENDSALVLGEDGTGKTSGICIPSIMKTDSCSMVIASLDNELAELTSGYRANLGKVFYFNWNLMDEPLKNEFFPRWNPLSNKEMPEKGVARDKYLFGLSQYFVRYNLSGVSLDDDYWPKLAERALFGLLGFFVDKIERASANDYFLSVLLDKDHLSKENKNLLLSYYVIMNKDYAAPAIKNLEHGSLNKDNYLPIGSWEGVPQLWQGKELSFAMFSDWLLQCFLMVKAQEQGAVDAWKIVLEYCLQEAEFFAYEDKVLDILRQLFYLSQKQRNVIFPMLFNLLSVFKNSSIRERTSTCDFSLNQIRASYNDNVSTVYSVIENRELGLVSSLFVDRILNYNCLLKNASQYRPLLFVFDNLELQPKYSLLSHALSVAEKQNMAFILTTNSINIIKNIYSQNEIENIINKTQYKILLSDNWKYTLTELHSLALAGLENSFVKENIKNSRICDASYYFKASKYLSSISKSVLGKGNEFLFFPKCFKMPFKIKSAYFVVFENLKNKASIAPNYFIDEYLLQNRNIQDMEIPELVQVLQSEGCKIQCLEDIDIFLSDRYEKAVETIEQVADKESVLADDISMRWQSSAENGKNDNSDWWMSEDAFDFSDVKENSNPFQKK